MKIAIHPRKEGFSLRWIEYCEQEGIPYKLVNCYSNDIIDQLKDCNALMWHFHQANPKDVLFAKELIYSLETAGKKVFPDFHTCWHFDDKVGQKYLLEAVGAPLVPTYVFFDKKEAMEWVESVAFPKVHKSRRGSGSDHVRLIHSKTEANNVVRKAFGRGFPQYDASSNLKERFRLFRHRKTGFKNVLKGIVRLGYTTEFSKVVGNEKGYVYFQDFIANNDHDIRINVVDGKAFAVRRDVRDGDFRASGSGFKHYEKHNFSEEVVKSAQQVARKLNLQAVAFDFVQRDGEFIIAELSYGFCDMTDHCTGYWDEDLNWHSGQFYEQDWMVDMMIKAQEENQNVAEIFNKSIY